MADVSVPTTPTNPDLREQVAAAIKAEDVLRGFDTRGEWYARFADAALSVVAPVLEGLCRTATEEQKRGDALYEERDKYIRLLMDEQEKVAALSSLLRGMARRVGEVRGEMRFATKHVDGWRKRADRLRSQRDKAREPGQTPATPDDAAARHMAEVTRHPRFAELYAQAAHNVHARDNHDQGDDTAPSSVQGDTTPEAACVHGQTADASHSYGAWRVGDHPGRDCELFIDTIDYVLRQRHAAQSAIQRNVRVGFAKAGRLLDLLETWGVVGPADGSAARKILVSSDQRSGIVAAIRKQATREAQS